MRIEPIPIGTGKGCAAALLVIGLEALQLVGHVPASQIIKAC